MVKRHKILAALLTASLISGVAAPISLAADTEDITNVETSIVTDDSGSEEVVEVEITVAKATNEAQTETTVTTGDGSEGDISLEIVEDGKVQENIQGSSNTASEVVTGDLKEDNADEYDQTTVTRTDRTATAEVGDIEITSGDPVYEDENVMQATEESDVADGYNYYWSDIYTVDGKSIIDGEVSSTYWSTGKTNAYIINASGEKVEDIDSEGVCQRVVAHDNGTPHDYTDDYELGGLYCADMSTGIQQILKYRKANLEDAEYYSEEDAAHLRAILTYGYTWDDDEDNGFTNLERMKAMLKDAQENGDEATKEILKDLDVDSLTREQVATATGMAVWTFGNRIELEEGERILYRSKDSNKEIATKINAVYDYLITLTKEADEKETQIINEEKFIGSMDMVIGEMVKDHANNADKDDTNDAYNVDLKFSLVVDHAGKSDDLVVKVIDDKGNVIKTARIAGNQKEGEDFGFAEKVTDGNTTYYVLKDLELIENSNTTFNLKLEGAQLLEDGVYVFESQQLTEEEWADQYIQYLKDNGWYEAEIKGAGSEEILREAIYKSLREKPSQLRSQNFIGYFNGMAEVDVNMAMNLTFNVEEATITTEHEWKEETEIRPTVTNPTGGSSNNSFIYTPSNYTLRISSLLTIEDEPVPLASSPNDNLIEIEDEEVPLADAPKTGSLAGLGFLLTSIGSGFGLWAVDRSDKKEKK